MTATTTLAPHYGNTSHDDGPLIGIFTNLFINY